MTVSKVQTVKYIHGIITPYNFDEHIPMEKNTCISYIPHYKCMEERPKLIIKVGAITNPVAVWFQLTHTYNDETVMTITDLEIMFLIRYSGWQEIYTTMD